MISPRPVKVRIAPSPTGDPHVGTAYMALFNFAFARHHGGSFILRIEDTDRVRARSSSEEMILSSLKWLGLTWDEGPDVGGPSGPYRQSERSEIYRRHTQQLLESGAAYYCFCTAERLDVMRKAQKAAGHNPGYDRQCRALTTKESSARVAENESHVVRLKMPVDGRTQFQDRLRGAVEIENTQLDDQVIMKADGFPTYHLANVVDDYLMGITHVIRAEEWISSTPKHVQLYTAFGWPQPEWIHMPLLRNPDKSKISKRKNPTSINYYRRAGILPTALLNFLGLMGWSFGDDQEVFSLEQMISKFDIGRVSLGGPVFDITKLNWMNQQYLQKMTDLEFSAHLRDEILNPVTLKALRPLVSDRMVRFEDLFEQFGYFFSGALRYEGVEIVPAGMDKVKFRQAMADLLERLDELYEWDAAHIKVLLEAHRSELDWKPKDYFMPVRLIMTGRKDSPPLNESIELIGREMARFRLRKLLAGPMLKD